MSKIRIGIAFAIVAAFALVITTIPTGAQDNSARDKDRAEIEELMWRYTRALDTGDGAAYAAAYTPDGEFRAGTTSTKGTEALKKLGETLKPQPGAARRPRRGT